MSKNILFITTMLGLISSLNQTMKGWNNIAQAPFNKPPTLKSQFTKNKGFKKHPRTKLGG